MRFIPTKIHGVLDYLVALLLLSSPWLFDFADQTAAMWVPIVLALATLVYSLLTDYEWGISRTLSMKTHLTFDFFNGVILAASPWIFDFSGRVYMPHLIIGVFEIIASLTTKSRSATIDSKGTSALA